MLNYTDTTNSLPVLKSIHLNCGQHLGNVHEASAGNSSQPGISMYGQVSILIVCASISQVKAAQMPLGLYSLLGNMARLVNLSKHLPGYAKMKRGNKKKTEINIKFIQKLEGGLKIKTCNLYDLW